MPRWRNGLPCSAGRPPAEPWVGWTLPQRRFGLHGGSDLGAPPGRRRRRRHDRHSLLRGGWAWAGPCHGSWGPRALARRWLRHPKRRLPPPPPPRRALAPSLWRLRSLSARGSVLPPAAGVKTHHGHRTRHGLAQNGLALAHLPPRRINSKRGGNLCVSCTALLVGTVFLPAAAARGNRDAERPALK